MSIYFFIRNTKLKKNKLLIIRVIDTQSFTDENNKRQYLKYQWLRRVDLSLPWNAK